MPAIIEAIDLHKTYHIGKIEVPALRGISFTIDKGEFVSVVGLEVPYYVALIGGGALKLASVPAVAPAAERRGVSPPCLSPAQRAYAAPLANPRPS